MTSLSKVSLVPGARSVILYTTILGAVGVFAPLATREEVDTLGALEVAMRSCQGGGGPSLCGRDHLAFRSAYRPVRAVIDGELCEHFFALDALSQRQVAEKVDGASVADLMRKLSSIRGSVAY